MGLCMYHLISVFLSLIKSINSFKLAQRIKVNSNFFKLSNLNIEIFESPILNNNINILSTKSVPNYNLSLSLAESSFGFGLGLYISVEKNVESVMLPKLSMICEYGKGKFDMRVLGDKCIAYSFESVESLVYYESKVLPLKDLIQNCILNSSPPHRKNIELLGHIINFDDINNMAVCTDKSHSKNVFVPSINDRKPYEYFGIYANDFAYKLNETDNDEAYLANTYKNALKIIWKVGVDKNGLITPINPVFVTKRDIVFTNKVPMELGLDYGWNYWSFWGRQFS